MLWMLWHSNVTMGLWFSQFIVAVRRDRSKQHTGLYQSLLQLSDMPWLTVEDDYHTMGLLTAIQGVGNTVQLWGSMIWIILGLSLWCFFINWQRSTTFTGRFISWPLSHLQEELCAMFGNFTDIETQRASQLIVYRHPGSLSNQTETYDIDLGQLDSLTLRQLMAFAKLSERQKAEEQDRRWPGLLMGAGEFQTQLEKQTLGTIIMDGIVCTYLYPYKFRLGHMYISFSLMIVVQNVDCSSQGPSRLCISCSTTICSHSVQVCSANHFQPNVNELWDLLREWGKNCVHIIPALIQKTNTQLDDPTIEHCHSGYLGLLIYVTL